MFFFRIKKFILSEFARFVIWFNAPPTRKDRIAAVIVGIIGGFWMGALGRMLLGDMPISLYDDLKCALGTAFILGVLSLKYPKVVTAIAFPFI